MPFKIYCQNIDNSMENGNSGNLVVYHGLTDCFVKELPAFYDCLSDYERTRANRFRQESDYNSYVSAHALLRIELSKLLKTKAKSIKIGVSENGKPFLRGIDLPFSLSRTRNHFAFAFGNSSQYLGIDIEQIKPEIDFKSISRNYFSVREQRLILSGANIADQKRTFFEIWTRKEALLKAIGIGIAIELSRVPVLEGVNVPNLTGFVLNCHMFSIATATKRDSIISIASSVDFYPEFKNLSYGLN